MPVKNRIKEFREAASLTQRGLGALLATSPEQVERHEAGNQISPGMAIAISRVFGQPLSAVFPDIGAQAPKSERDWKRLGFDLLAPLPTWHLNIQLRDVDEAFVYLVDSADCARLDRICDGVNVSDFISFASCGRSIYVNSKSVQRIFVVEDGAALQPGTRHTFGALERKFASLRLYFKGRQEPWTLPCLEMEEFDIESVFASLDGAIDIADEFLSFYDDEFDLVYVRTGEIALVEVPTPELIDEMQQLGSDFWQSDEQAPEV